MMPKCIITLLVALLLLDSQVYCREKIASQPISTSIESSKENAKTPSVDNDATRKIIERAKLEKEGYLLARQGLYGQALLKYKAAQNPVLLNYDYERPEVPLIQIYIRQGKFEQALQIVNDNFKKRPQSSEVDRERREILSLIEARDTKSNKPIYDYINYAKMKYPKYFPPNGYFVGMSDIYINDFIHLYDYMHDYDGGIAFMDEVIKYHENHKDPNHRSAHKKDVTEYKRVKQAWDLDKKTGQHGHLQDVIKTSDIISW